MSYTLAYTGAEIDALLGKIDAIFVAEYGSTIYSEITAAIAAGNKVIVANAGKVFVYAGTDDNGGYVFTQSGPNAAKPNATYVTLSTGNVWSTNSVDLATLQQFYASLMEDTASGSIASFPDGAEGVPVKELTADIEPIQDLHGQPFPYPENGYKNLLIPTPLSQIKTWNTSGSWSDNKYTLNGVTITVNGDGTYGVSGTASANVVVKVAGIAQLANVNIADNHYYNGGTTTAYYQYTNNADNARQIRDTDVEFTRYNTTTYPNQQLELRVDSGVAVGTVTIKPMIRLTSYADATFAPYSNICPISGYTGAEIHVTGINVWDETYTAGGVVNGSTGTLVGTSMMLGYTDYVRIKGGVSYYFNGSGLASVVNGLAWYDENKTYISGKNFGTLSTVGEVTAPSNAAFVRFSVHVDEVGAISFNYPSTDTSYHGYNGQTYSISWTDEGTVYKGTAEYKGGGEWEISDIYGELDLGTLGWTTNQGAFYYGANAGWKPSADGRCEIYQIIPETAIGSSPNNSVQMRANGIYIKDARFTAAADFTAAVSGIMLRFEAASPTTFTVSGPDPETLLGDNNIWSDTGDISVKYRCNTALYIEKKLGA